MSENVPTAPGPTELETLNGGGRVRVKARRGGDATIEVTVAQLAPRRFNELLQLWGNRVGMAELFTGLSPEQIDELPYSSIKEIVDEGIRINEDFFVWCEDLANDPQILTGRAPELGGMLCRVIDGGDLASLITSPISRKAQGSPSGKPASTPSPS